MSTEDKLRRALEYIVRVGTWTGTDGIQYTSQECRIARQALAATQEQPARPKPNWLQGDNETIREWREGDPMPADTSSERDAQS